MSDIEMKQLMRKGAQTLKSLAALAESNKNREQFDLKFKLHEILSPLIHIHCPCNLKCANQNEFTGSDEISELHGVVFWTLGSLSFYRDDVHHYLIDKHNIIEHAISVVVSYSGQRDSNRMLGNILSGPLRYLCRHLLQNIQRNQEVGQIAGVGLKLGSLMSFDRMRKQNWRLIFDAKKVRIWSGNCLNWIQTYGNEEIQEKSIKEWKFLEAQIGEFGCCGGSQEGDNAIITNNLYYTSQFFTQQRKGTEQCPAQPGLIKIMGEILEQEGGMDEIDSNIFIGVKTGFIMTNSVAKSAYTIVTNAYKQISLINLLQLFLNQA
ncbi:MAG: hypothetical protein EZS28_017746 [Streblomastix strix]|uniref:Uncharacterized protein n=1 Tax=Streblomastix strix TaxID=222440 RepID=A0A5J4VWT0_9EUKA|nr:MAG: hypothetical protein EZS28_017746 [Streblomastix strix]